MKINKHGLVDDRLEEVHYATGIPLFNARIGLNPTQQDQLVRY